MATNLSLPTTTTVYQCQSTRLAASVTTWPDSGDTATSYVTGCCGTDVTGSGSGSVVCRGCHEPVSSRFALPVILSGWEALAGSLGCPCPGECAADALWRIEQATDSV